MEREDTRREVQNITLHGPADFEAMRRSLVRLASMADDDV